MEDRTNPQFIQICKYKIYVLLLSPNGHFQWNEAESIYWFDATVIENCTLLNGPFSFLP